MKLAILVVYMVAVENERLLDLHLAMIARHTGVDYTIYASIHGLLPQFQSKLTENPRVEICLFPATSETGSKEHAYYLERLAASAIEDGASHLVTLHVDSFPIAPHWAETMAGYLTPNCRLVSTSKRGIPDKPSAGLFFSREFYLDYKPVFALVQKDLDSDSYRRFREAYPVVAWDSGMGYVFRAYAEGLSWCPLERMDKAGGSAIYGDLIFHLEGAYVSRGVTVAPLNPAQKSWRNRLKTLKYALLPLIPASILDNPSSRLRNILLGLNRHLIVDSLHDEERRELLSDPEVYLTKLRSEGGGKTND